MSNFRLRKIFVLTLLLSTILMIPIKSTATGNPLLLLDYEDIDEQHFVVKAYLSDISSLSVFSVPIAFNPESVLVCGYDNETGTFVDITDGTIASTKDARSGKFGLEIDETMFDRGKWSGVLVCNDYYPYISNKEGLIKFTMYSFKESFAFEGKNNFFKIYFKKISDEPSQIRIATKDNAVYYDQASSTGLTFINMTEVLDMKHQYEGDVFSEDVEVNRPNEDQPQSGGSSAETDTGSTNLKDKDDEEDSSQLSTEKTKDDPEDESSDDHRDTDVDELNSATAFNDVAKEFWAYEAIQTLAMKGIINGYEDGSFKPNGSITRAELATIVSIAKGCEIEDNKKVFEDSGEVDWYNKYLVATYGAGFISGYPDGTFKPNNLISRQDLCVVLSKAFLSNNAGGDAELSFVDASEVDAYAFEAVKKIAGAGIVKGRDGNVFAPKANATRAEVARMIYLCMQADI